MKRLVGIGLVGWALSPGSSINAPATSSLVFQGSTGLRTHGWSWALDPARNELYTTDWMLTSPD